MNSSDLQSEHTMDNANEKFQLDSRLVSMTVEKVSPNDIQDKHLTQSNGANVRFPPLNINKSIIAKVSKNLFFCEEFIFHLLSLKFIALRYSSIVSLTLHDEYGKKLNIKNTAKPFDIRIPHKTNILMPPMIHQHVKSLPNDQLFKYYYINLTHNQNLSISLHIDLESENQNLSYLFIIRFSGAPNLKANLIDERKLVCPKGCFYNY